MKKIVFTLALLAIMSEMFGQARYFSERYIYNQANIYPVLINPGATGFNQDHLVMFNYRNKWASFEGSPKTVTFSYDGQVADRLGFGALIVSDGYGELETTKGQIAFAYGIESPTNKIGFGLSAEYIQHKVNGTAVANSFLDPVDPLLLKRLDGHNYFDASFGLHGVFDNRLTYGLVFPGLVSSSLDDDEDLTDRKFSYMVNLGYRLESEANDIVATPGVAIKDLQGVPTFIELSLTLGLLEEKLTGGLNYSVGGDERLGFLLGLQINSLNFLYGYNISRHEFQDYNNGSHEITLAFNISGYSSKSAEEKKLEMMDDN